MHIPARYPIVEGATGLAFVIAALPFAGTFDVPTSDPRLAIAGGLELVAFLYLAAISVVLAVIDLDTKRLPNSIVLPGYAVGAALLGGAGILRGDVMSLVIAAVGAVAAALFFFVLYVIGGMGFGDVKLAGVVGLFLGFLGIPQLTVGIAAGFAIGAVVGVGADAAAGQEPQDRDPVRPLDPRSAPGSACSPGSRSRTATCRLIGLA